MEPILGGRKIAVCGMLWGVTTLVIRGKTYNYLANSDADFLKGNAFEVTEKTGLDSIWSNLTKMGLQFQRRLQHTSRIGSEKSHVVLSIQRDASTKFANSSQILVNFLLKVILYLYSNYCIIIIIIISLSSSLRSLECWVSWRAIVQKLTVTDMVLKFLTVCGTIGPYPQRFQSSPHSQPLFLGPFVSITPSTSIYESARFSAD